MYVRGDAVKRSKPVRDSARIRSHFTSGTDCMCANGPDVSTAHTVEAIWAYIRRFIAYRDIRAIIRVVVPTIKRLIR